MSSLHSPGGLRHPIPMLAPGDVVADGSPSRVLHRDALPLGPLPERRLLVLGQSKSHSHAGNGISLIPPWRRREEYSSTSRTSAPGTGR